MHAYYAFVDTMMNRELSPEYDPVAWALQIAHGLQALDRIGIVHRELRSPTVLLAGHLSSCLSNLSAKTYLSFRQPGHMQAVVLPAQHCAGRQSAANAAVNVPLDVA